MAKAELMNYEQALEKFEVVIGLEVHVELNTKTKMFCGCRNDFGDEPNTNVCPVCLGLPGALPVVNKRAVESAIKIGLAIGCDIAPNGRFARKNYFYPDLAKNFQTSQYDEPIASEGALEVEVPSGNKFNVLIERAHMEEDAGKLTHVGGATVRIQGADEPEREQQHGLQHAQQGMQELVEYRRRVTCFPQLLDPLVLPPPPHRFSTGCCRGRGGLRGGVKEVSLKG